MSPKVLHIMESANIGGAERSLLILLPALRDAGWDVEFLGFAVGPSRFADELAALGIPVRMITTTKLFAPSVIRQLRRGIRASAPDVVHTHLLYADFEANLAKIGLDIPSVRTIHGPATITAHWKNRVASRVAGALVGRTITVSEHLAQLLVERRQAPSDRIETISHGVPVLASISDEARAQARRSLGLDRDSPVVVCSSRLIPGKGHGMLVRAMSRVAESCRAQLLVIGSGPLEGHIRALARELLPEGTWQVKGFLSDVDTALIAADVYALPTEERLGEGSPVAAIEAMAAGLPVVASDLPALRDLIEPDRSGVLVRPGDESDLAAALVALLKSPDRRAALGARGAEVVRDRYSVERSVQETVRIYRDVINAT